MTIKVGACAIERSSITPSLINVYTCFFGERSLIYAEVEGALSDGRAINDRLPESKSKIAAEVV